MNARERFSAYLEGRPVDRVPNLNIIMQFGAQCAGIPFSRYLNDYRSLVDSEIAAAREFGIDCVCAISDPYREAEGFGLKVRYPDDDLPVSKGPIVACLADLRKLAVPDPLAARRMQDRLLAVCELKSRAGDAFPVIGWVEGPIAEAADLMGVSELMYNLADEPAFVAELMDICLEGAIAFAREQIKQGADAIGIGDAAASLIGPALFQEFVLPRERRLIDEIHNAGARAKLHICGNISHILPQIALTGADIVDIDHAVDFSAAIGALAPGQMANGNYDPVSVLLFGDAAAVDAAVRSCHANRRGRRAMISAGCEVPRGTPKANLLQVSRTLAELGRE